MHVFDRIDPLTLDRREWQLWMLALTVIFILTTGMVLLMYPTIFSNPVVLTGTTMRKSFFGFCALSVLLLGYLLDRQIVISNLRKQLTEEHKRIMAIRHEASADLLETLPRFEHFQDRVVMEYRRAATTGQPLSLVVVLLRASPNLPDPREVSTAFGDAAKVLMHKLRGEDSIYLFNPGVFGIVLPGVEAKNAYRVAERITEGLRDASGVSGRFTYEVRVLNYPEHAATAREIEQAVRALLPESPQDSVPVQLADTPTRTR